MSNYLDTRDLAKRLDELEDLETALADAKEAVQEAKAAIVENGGRTTS